MPKPLTLEDVSALLRAAVKDLALPTIELAAADTPAPVVTLTYPHALYNARTSADTEAIAALDGWSITDASADDVHKGTKEPVEGSRPHTTVVTLQLAPAAPAASPSKKQKEKSNP